MKAPHCTLGPAALLLALAGSATAQMGPMGAPHHDGHPGPHTAPKHEHKALRHQQHLSELKNRLRLEAHQEAAWTTFANSMQPPSHPAVHPDRAMLDKLSTPERIDQMQAMHAAHDTEMTKRTEAILAFYTVLSDEQKKRFDAASHHFVTGHSTRRAAH